MNETTYESGDRASIRRGSTTRADQKLLQFFTKNNKFLGIFWLKFLLKRRL